MRNFRKRPIDETKDEDEGSSSFIMLHGTKKIRMPKRLASAESTKNVHFEYESCKNIQVQNDSKATATLETKTEFPSDAKGIHERVSKNKVYKGINHYTDYRAGFRREQTAGGVIHGPVRASAHIRVTSRFDFQSDICKDYKVTGDCGYGDSCKFLHDRGDYKSGWQVEKEWEEEQKAKKRCFISREEIAANKEDDDQETLLSSCPICRQSFVDPVVTLCKHYFCGCCALKHHLTNKKCFVCKEPTQGTFNIAREIRKRLGANRR